MSSDEQGLLAAIVDSPDDDAHRLVYADWLDENGQADRARLIRVQVEIRRLESSGDPADQDRADELTETVEFPLLDAHEAAWHAELPRFAGLDWVGNSEDDIPGEWFDRGFFIGLIAKDWQALARHGAEAFAATPVRRLQLRRLTVKGAAALSEWPLLARVRELHLDKAKLTDNALAALARSPHLEALARLRLCGNRISDPGVRALAQARFDGLRSLNLKSNRIGPAGAQALAMSGWLGRLEHLDLSSNWDLSAAGLAYLAEVESLPSYLNLNGTLVTSLGAQFLAQSSAAERLGSLCLGWCDVDDDGVRALIDSPHLANLTLLDLRGNRLSPAMQQAASERFVSRPGRHFCLYFDPAAAGAPA